MPWNKPDGGTPSHSRFLPQSIFKVEGCLGIRRETHAAETLVKLVVTQIFCDGEQNPNLSLWRVKITNAVIVVHFGCPMIDKQVWKFAGGWFWIVDFGALWNAKLYLRRPKGLGVRVADASYPWNMGQMCLCAVPWGAEIPMRGQHESRGSG